MMPKVNLKDYVVDNLENQKIEDIIVIDTSKTSSMSDWVIIGSGRSGKQIESSIENLKIDLKKKKLAEGQISGVANDGWIIFDLGNIIVHLFVPAVRDIYQLEKLLNPKKRTVKKEETVKKTTVKKTTTAKKVVKTKKTTTAKKPAKAKVASTKTKAK